MKKLFASLFLIGFITLSSNASLIPSRHSLWSDDGKRWSLYDGQPIDSWYLLDHRLVAYRGYFLPLGQHFVSAESNTLLPPFYFIYSNCWYGKSMFPSVTQANKLNGNIPSITRGYTVPQVRQVKRLL